MPQTAVSELVREHARDAYIRSARRRGLSRFQVNVGEVHRALKLHNRIPLVCAALQSKKFLKENRLQLVGRTGPPSGQSTTVTLTYEILKAPEIEPSVPELFLGLRGIAKDAFKSVGGGEAFIRRERQHFYSSARKDPSRDYGR